MTKLTVLKALKDGKSVEFLTIGEVIVYTMTQNHLVAFKSSPFNQSVTLAKANFVDADLDFEYAKIVDDDEKQTIIDESVGSVLEWLKNTVDRDSKNPDILELLETEKIDFETLLDTAIAVENGKLELAKTFEPDPSTKKGCCGNCANCSHCKH